MSRLTNKWKKGYTPNPEAFDKNQDITPLLDKLGKLEDLEEQLGCPLEVYVKIQLGLVDTIYVKRYETVREYWDETGVRLEQKECLEPRPITRVDRRYFRYQDFLGKEDMFFSEYGTEFWLKEDKSE